MYARCAGCTTKTPDVDWQRSNACPKLGNRYQPTNHVGPPDNNLLNGLTQCPTVHAYAPCATEAHKAFRWWEKGQLHLLYPGGVPVIVSEAIECVARERDDWTSENRRLNTPKT